MESLFSDFTGWYWLGLALLLLIGEALGANGFLLGFAISAIVIGVVLFITPFNWHIQFLLFAILGVAATWIYFVKFKKFNAKSDQPLLNKRGSQLLGQVHTLTHGIENNKGKIQVGDTLWTVTCDQPLVAGDSVKLVELNGMEFRVEKA